MIDQKLIEKVYSLTYIGRGFHALVGYGDDAFIEHFKEKLGTSYIRDHEKGLKEFFATVRSEILPQLHTVDELRKVANLPSPDGQFYSEWQARQKGIT